MGITHKIQIHNNIINNPVLTNIIFYKLSIEFILTDKIEINVSESKEQLSTFVIVLIPK